MGLGKSRTAGFCDLLLGGRRARRHDRLGRLAVCAAHGGSLVFLWGGWALRPVSQASVCSHPQPTLHTARCTLLPAARCSVWPAIVRLHTVALSLCNLATTVWHVRCDHTDVMVLF